MSEIVVGSAPNAVAASLESDVGSAAASANDRKLPAHVIAAVLARLTKSLTTGAAYDAFDAADVAAGATDEKLTEEEALAHGFVYKDLDGNGFLDRGDVDAAAWADQNSGGTVDGLITEGEAEWAGAKFENPDWRGLMSVNGQPTPGLPGRQSPDGVDLMILDLYQPDGTGLSHGAKTSYVAAEASHAEGVEVYPETPVPQGWVSFNYSELANTLKALASSESPPEVINMSFSWSPAVEFMRSFRDDMSPSEVNALLDEVMKKGQSMAASPVMQEIRDALKKLVEQGTTIIFSAGNDGEATQKLQDLEITVPEGFYNSPDYDDMPPGVIVVGGTDSNNPDSPAWSETTPTQSVDVAADANEVTISYDGNVSDGTSYAAPQIAGLVADMKALDPSLTPAQIEGILVQSATPQPGKEALVGAGVVNREKALAIVQAGLATPSP